MHTIYDNPLPPGWLEASLGSLVETKRGCTWTKEQERDRQAEGTIPVIRIPNIQSSLDLTDLLHIHGLSADQQTSSAVTKGWTLMVGSNGNPKRIGDSVLIEEDREMVFASFLFALRPKLDGETKISDEFFACWLHGHRVHEFVSETSQMTTGLANISWSACRKLPVRFPKHKEEQTRIAKTLKAADDHIRALEAQIRNAELVKKALMQSAFPYERDSAGLPTLNSLIVAPVTNGYSPVCPDYETGRWVLGLDALSKHGFNPAGKKPAPTDDSKLEGNELFVNDILISRSNTRERVGFAGLYDGDPTPCFYPDLMMRVRVDHARIRPRYLDLLLQSEFARRYFQSRAGGTSGSMVKIKERDVRQMPVILLTPDEQDVVVDRFKACAELIYALRVQLTAARRVKQSLLQNLLTGKIRLKA
jgi:restriction endonuclease S subunit